MSNDPLRTNNGVPKTSIGDRYLIDGNMRFRISTLHTIADYKHNYPPLPSFWNEKLVGSGTSSYLAQSSLMRIGVGSVVDDEALRCSMLYHPYSPGKPIIAMFTFIFGRGENGLTREVFYGDSNNGLIFRQKDDQLEFAIRSDVSGTVVENVITQQNWNIDTLNGNGNSGISIDITKEIFLRIEFVWLSAGPVRFGFEIGHDVIYAHQEEHANVISEPFMSTASLPIGYRIFNHGSTTKSNNLDFVCSSVCQEGDSIFSGYQCSVDTFGSTISIDNSQFHPILAIRMKNTFLGKANRVAVLMNNISIAATNSSAEFRVLFNPSVTITNWNSNGSYNPIEFSTNADISNVSGGHIMNSRSVQNGESVNIEPKNNKFGTTPFGLDLEGNNSLAIGLIVAKSGSQANANIKASIDFDAFY